MPGPGKWHLRGPVISMLNHICESDSVRVGLCSVCPRLGRNYGTWSQLSGIRWNQRVTTFKEGLDMPPRTRTDLLTQTHTYTGRLLEACLTYNLQRQHVPSHFPTEHMVRSQKTKHRLTSPLHSARGQTWFLWLDPFTQTPKHSTSLARVSCLHPCNNSDMYCKEISVSSLSPPRVLDHWALLCYKYGSTSKQCNGQSDSFIKNSNKLLGDKCNFIEIEFRIQSLRRLFVTVKSCNGTK